VSTKIEWTDETWNPIRARVSYDTIGWHCERVSPGCENCYAERINRDRFGTGLPYTRPSRDKVSVCLDEKVLVQPLHWRKPRRVFVCSMTDLFGEWVPDDMLDRIFAVMALAPQHTFQVLTKRPERMREYFRPEWKDGGDRLRWRARGIAEHVAYLNATGPHPKTMVIPYLPLPNCWLGVSAEDQRWWDERVPELLATPAAVRFVSAEPLLSPIETGWDEWGYVERPDWLIVGGESGPGARPCDISWIRSLRDQCQAAGVPVFVKQLGSRWAHPGIRGLKGLNPKGGDPAEWPEDLRVRVWPS